MLIDKPWGFENLLEKNDKYMFKLLKMNAGHACSLQYHEFKTETVYVLEGVLKLYIGETKDSLTESLMHPGEHITIRPYTVHRMEALEDATYLEASTPELEDVIRLEDRYKRS